MSGKLFGISKDGITDKLRFFAKCSETGLGSITKMPALLSCLVIVHILSCLVIHFRRQSSDSSGSGSK